MCSLMTSGFFSCFRHASDRKVTTLECAESESLLTPLPNEHIESDGRLAGLFRFCVPISIPDPGSDAVIGTGIEDCAAAAPAAA